VQRSLKNNLEIEIKARVQSLQDVEKKIIEMGGIFVREELQEDEYFSHPCKDFANTDEALRLRKNGSNIILTYKGKRIDNITKTREEYEAIVNGEIREILIKLGFSPFANISKTRKIYILGDIEISLDNVKELGSFVEIETHGDYKDGKERIMDLAKKLSLGNLEKRSYLEMVVNKDG